MNEPLETLLRIAGTAEAAVPVLSLAAYIPQWRVLVRSRDSSSISLMSWGIWAVSYAIATFYSTMLLLVTGRGLPMVITTALGLCFVLFTMLLVWRLRRPAARDAAESRDPRGASRGS